MLALCHANLNGCKWHKNLYTFLGESSTIHLARCMNRYEAKNIAVPQIADLTIHESNIAPNAASLYVTFLGFAIWIAE